MALCRVCHKKLLGYGYTIHHGNYHEECLKKKYPDAEFGGIYAILTSPLRNDPIIINEN